MRDTKKYKTLGDLRTIHKHAVTELRRNIGGPCIRV